MTAIPPGITTIHLGDVEIARVEVFLDAPDVAYLLTTDRDGAKHFYTYQPDLSMIVQRLKVLLSTPPGLSPTVPYILTSKHYPDLARNWTDGAFQ